MPQRCQSGRSARTWSSTSAGSAAGPAAKLNTRTSALRRASGAGGRLAGPGLRAVLGHVLPFARLEALDALDADQPLALIEADQAHALRVTALYGDLIHRGAHQRAGGADEHDLLPRHHLQGRHGVAVAAPGLQREAALAAAPVLRNLPERRPLPLPGREPPPHVPLP